MRCPLQDPWVSSSLFQQDCPTTFAHSRSCAWLRCSARNQAPILWPSCCAVACRALPDVWAPHALVPRAARAPGRLWRAAPQRVQRRAAGPDARAPLPAGRCARLLQAPPSRPLHCNMPGAIACTPTRSTLHSRWNVICIPSSCRPLQCTCLQRAAHLMLGCCSADGAARLFASSSCRGARLWAVQTAGLAALCFISCAAAAGQTRSWRRSAPACACLTRSTRSLG